MNNNATFDRYALLASGVLVDAATDAKSLQQFIDLLKPVRTDFNLIRLGGDSDGGYLIPSDLTGIEFCFSPGVDFVANFERDLLGYGIKSHLIDGSVESVPGNLEVASFLPRFLGGVNSDGVITLERWVMGTDAGYSSSDLILQMDIEGAEYEVLLSTPSDLLRRFRIAVVEFHNVESWAHRGFFALIVSAVKKLTSLFHVVHVHPNNAMGIVDLNGVLAPRVFEVTFLRKDRALDRGFETSYPHPLDRPNLLDRADLCLPRNWVGG